MCFIGNTRTAVYHTEDCFCNQWLLEENKTILEEKPLTMKPCSFCKPQLETE